MDEYMYSVPRSNSQQLIVHKLEPSCLSLGEGYHQQHQHQVKRYHQSVLSEMALPGFRFHPTEEELVGYYLRRMVEGKRNSVELIASLDLYQHDPWELPAMALMGEKEWFFFCPRDKKYPNGARPNRVTASGYWKATGTDRPVRCNPDFRCCVGLKKTLVFYTGRAPRGNKTDWIMNEYRLPKLLDKADSAIFGPNSCKWRNSLTSASEHGDYIIENDVALCRIYRKSNSAAGINIGATSIHSQSVLTKLSCSNNFSSSSELSPHPQQQIQQQQQHVTRPLRLNDSPPDTNARTSTTFTRDSSGNDLGLSLKPSQGPASLAIETSAARVVEAPSPSFAVAPTSDPMNCAVTTCFFSALPAGSSSPCPSQIQVSAIARATNAGNLRSSHALMARLLMEETCYSSCRIDSNSSSSGTGVPEEQQHASGHGNQRVHAEEQRRISKSSCEDLPFTSQLGRSSRMVVGSHMAHRDDLTFRA